MKRRKRVAENIIHYACHRVNGVLYTDKEMLLFALNQESHYRDRTEELLRRRIALLEEGVAGTLNVTTLLDTLIKVLDHSRGVMVLRYILSLERERRDLLEALEFYAAEENYREDFARKYTVAADEGAFAREAISALKQRRSEVIDA